MARKVAKVKNNIDKSKLLVNVGEPRKRWLEAVAGLLPSGTVTEVIRTLIDQASVEDPEGYASKVEKHRVRAALEAIEGQERELEEKKAALMRAIEGRQTPATAAR